MPDLLVNLITPDGTPFPDTQLPQDAKVRAVVADIIDQLNLPSIDRATNQTIEYYLETTQGKRLDDDQTMLAVGLERGATLSIKSSSIVPPVSVVQATPPPVDGSLELNVRLLDINQNVLETFRPETTIHDVLTQIITKHRLPTRDEKFRQGKIYQIWSKTAGSFLQEKLTLRESMIPQRDTLVISTHETPGC